MAKLSSIEKNKHRTRLSTSHAPKRLRLKIIMNNRELPVDQRFSAALKLAEMPRNGSKTRIRNRCELSGRPRGYYRKFRLSRIALRELASSGMLPGVVKASW